MLGTLIETTLEYVMFVSQTGPRQTQFSPQFDLVVTTDVAQFPVFQIVPDPFDWIQIGGVSRQAFQPNPLPCRPQELFDRLAPVDRRAIPDDPQLTRHVTQQVAQKLHHARPVEGPNPTLLIFSAKWQDSGLL